MSRFSFTLSNFWLGRFVFPLQTTWYCLENFRFFSSSKNVHTNTREKQKNSKQCQCHHIYWTGPILFPRGRAPFGQHQESRPLRGSKFLSMGREFVSYSQLIRFVRLYSEHAQSAESLQLAVSDLPGGPHSWCWPKGARPLGTRMKWSKKPPKLKRSIVARLREG